MATLTPLDVSQPISNKDGTPTQYFEELWFELVTCLKDIQDSIDDLQSQIDTHHP